MNLNIQNCLTYSQNIAPNTFIGGIAKQGGIGVNAPIDTPYKLTTKLQISINRISGFRVIGENVECKIKGTYGIPNVAFGNTTLATANQNITYYYDEGNLVTNIENRNVFRFCANFFDFKFNALNYIGNATFMQSGIINANLSHLPAVITGEWQNMFNNCLQLVSADLGELTSGVSIFSGCRNIETISMKIKIYGQMFRNAGKIGSNFYNEYVLEAGRYCFADGCGFEEVNMPNATVLKVNCFYRGNASTNQYLKKVIAPKVISIGNFDTDGSGRCFERNTQLELVDIRACKTFNGTGNFNTSMKAGGVIKVHQAMITSGDPNGELLYLKNTRGVTVEFYNDLGVYVSTL